MALESVTVYGGSNAHQLVKNKPGRVMMMLAHNNNLTKRYLQFFNIASGTPSGAPRYAAVEVAAGSFVGMHFGEGMFFNAGITWGWSTTRDTYTAATASDHATTVFYK